MKQLLTYTSTMLRTALLLGALALLNIPQVTAQTAEQWAELPDAFETMDPATIINDGKYYYIQFYQAAHDKCSYLTDCGVDERARSKDFLPFANNRLWTLESARDDVANHFKLRNKNGHYIQFGTFRGDDGNKPRVGCVDNFAAGSILTFHPIGNDGYHNGYYITAISGDSETYPMYRPSYVEWADLAYNTAYNSGSADVFRLRFAKLKSNSAFIIYYRGEGTDNSNSGAATTRHYLTYSGTDSSLDGTNLWWSSDVSSRQSIIPKDKSLCTLPTLAAYHKDGLWTLEETGTDGQFYIKKYGSTTGQYLNEDEHWLGTYGSELGNQDATKGIYILEDPLANRYTRIQNVLEEVPLTNSWFFRWNGYGADATKQSDTPIAVDFNVGNDVALGAGTNNNMVAGWSTVDYQTYADISDYTKMAIRGTQGMQLRVLMSRQGDGGPLVEKNVTIGSDGKAEVDLTNLTLNQTVTASATVNMTYICGSVDAVDTSYGDKTTETVTGGYNNGYKWNTGPGSSISEVKLGEQSWGVNNIIYLKVDASAIKGTITKVTLKANASGNNARETEWGAGYTTNMEWSSTMTWNSVEAAGGRNITDLTPVEDRPTVPKDETQQISLDITGAFTNDPDKIATIVVYETRPGGGSFSNPTVEVEYSSVSYAHLNAIKTSDSSPSGTISSITLQKDPRYLHHAHGDGWQVMQWSGTDDDYWYAGFCPVEVPDPNQDDSFQVLLKVKKDDPSKIKLTGATNNPTITPLEGSTLDNMYGATFTPTADYSNVFQIKNMPTGCYEKIVVKFANAVPAGWYIHAYGARDAFYSLEGLTQYEITLDPSRTIEDFTIFNWEGVRSSITISECNFTPATPSCDLVEMLNYEGNSDAYSETPGLRKTWHLQQVDNYEHFRLMAPNGQYFQADGKMTSDVNSAKIFTNTSLLDQFELKWFYVNAAKETYVDYMITHRQSYLKKYATQHANLDLDKQGLATEVQSDWWDYDLKTQKVNHFEITHYVKRGKTIKVEFPTILNNSSDHIYYQRWYHFAEKDDKNTSFPDGTDIEGFKTHVTLDTPENQEVQYYVYKNGIVTGDKLYWGDDVGLQRHANRNFYFTNHDGKSFTVAADVSRYSDFTYANESSKLEGDLEEPSLTMRYVYYMNDAKSMAKKLTAKTFKGFDFIDSKEGLNFLEAKTFHFPARQIFYENQKKCGYRGEFIGLRHLFSDYWVFSDGNASSTDDNNLLSAVNDDNRSGKIEVKIYDPNHTGIRLGGYNPNMTLAERDGFVDGADDDYQGFYFYDMMDVRYANNIIYENKMSYGDSRFIVFRYPTPENGVSMAKKTGPNNPVYINVYFKVDDNTRYQLAQYTIIFDEGTVTLPYTAVNGSVYVKDDASNTNQQFKDRDPKNLVNKAGKPIAKITFDYPSDDTYHFPDKGESRHDQHVYTANSTIANSSPVPLTFDNTNYAFDGDGCNWGSYAMVSEMNTVNGNKILAVPANTITYGYGPTDSEIANNPQLQSLRPDDGLQNGFLYIDASEQPGDICSAPFAGDFCANDRLMFSGWISGSNKAGADYNRCPGGVTLTVKGERNKHDENGRIVYDENGIPEKETMTLYRFCPGQIYELDNGRGNDGSGEWVAQVNEQGEPILNDQGEQVYALTGVGNHVVWQQFYFEFIVTDKYDRHWIEVNNNCVSSRGGDFMLDNVEVYAVVPEVIPGVNTPLCISVDENGNTVTDMRLLKLSVDHNKLKTAGNVNENSTGSSELGFVFLDKKVFLETFKTGLQALTSAEKEILHLSTFDFHTISLDELADAIDDGELVEIKEVEVISAVQEGQVGYEEYKKYLAHYKAFEVAYHNAFDAAILGNKTTWHSNLPISETNPMNSSILYFEWKHRFTDMEPFSFAKAVNKTHPVYAETTKDGEKFVVMNGNYPELSWKTNTDYYIVTTNQTFDPGRPFVVFNLCSECNNASEFRIDPPYTILGLEKSEETSDYVVCEGQIPTLLTDLKGYDLDGFEVPMQDINYDWWLGDADYTETETVTDDENNTTTITTHPKLATLENYHKQSKTIGSTIVRLDKALSTLRIYYPDVTDLHGITKEIQKSPHPALTLAMVTYLQELVDAGELVLHQKSISVPAEPVGKDDPYFYLVACPIHDEMFEQALNPGKSIVNNGSMEGDDTSSFWMGEPSTTGKQAVTLTAGDGKDNTQGFTISSSGTEENAWDTQFFIRANKVLSVGTTFHLEFDYKATASVTIPTQAHSEPGNYNHWACIGDIAFTKDEWKHFSQDIYVSNEMGNGVNGDKKNSFQTIAFNLGKTGSEVTYYFDNVSLIPKHYVAYFCDEPQGLRVKVGDKAPILKTGFVPNENGFSKYNYPTDSDPVLSIRLAKAAQFETVQHGKASEAPVEPSASNANTTHYLWLPIRNAMTQTAAGVIKKSDDYNVYLASTNDPIWDKKIYKAMNGGNGSLPVIGKIVQLEAINTKGTDPDTGQEIVIHSDDQNDENRLCIYFIKYLTEKVELTPEEEDDDNLVFTVREGYNYTLSLPFQEVPDEEGNDVNACDGTILINLKIVPDYEVWTGAAGLNNTDWNNDENWRRADGNTADNSGVNGDELYVGAAAESSPLYGYKTNQWNYRSAKDRVFRKGFAPLYCTRVLIKSDEWGNAPVLYDAIDGNALNTTTNSRLTNAPFPNLRDKDGWDGTTGDNATKATATPILRYDMQARLYDIWPETYGENVYPNKGRVGDLIAEMYQINSCDEIVFQPTTELRNAHLLNYNNAWVEYQLDNKRWYLLGSPLQGTISGEWYATKKTAQQKTTYYDPVTFTKYTPITTITSDDNPAELGYYILRASDKKYVPATETTPGNGTVYYKKIESTDYDRYNPAIYQRSWDKAKAVLYEVGSTYDTADDSQTQNLGNDDEGIWKNNGTEDNPIWQWQTPTGGADEYLDRLGYKPMVSEDGVNVHKANVAIKGIWSNTYNDAQVDYANGGFSVMVLNHLKGEGEDESGDKSIIRLPKEDTMYDYYEFSQSNEYDGGTDTELSDVRTKDRALNRGRLKSDKLLPTSTKKKEKEASIYGDMRDYTRIPIKEDALTAMNNSFVNQGDDPATAGFFTETAVAGASNLGYYLVENPFPCGMDMKKFFAANPLLQKKYWLLTTAASGQNPRQVLVQQAGDEGDDNDEWIRSDGTNFATNAAVVAPGQGFFVEVVRDEGTTPPAAITFNLDMQAQSRYGVQSGNPRTFNIEIGQEQEMEELKELVDHDNDPTTPDVEQTVYVDVDLNNNGIYGETNVTIGEGDEAVTRDEKEPVMVPKYEKDNDGNYVLDADGNKKPVLKPKMQDVTLYTYIQSTDADKQFPLRSRTTRSGNKLPGLVITAQRGNDESNALVMVRDEASDDFLPSEDTETFISTEDLKTVPTVYTLCGRLATTINSIHDFTCLPLGVESSSDAPCTLTFNGVELLGDSVGFYDAVERKLTPLKSGMKFTVSGQTQNRYYLVSSLNEEEVAEETHLQIFTEGLTAKVISSTAEPITSVRCFDMSGRLIHTATPQTSEYSFSLPKADIYIIEAQTEKDRKTKKVMVK